MKRREFLASGIIGAVAWPRAARTQQLSLPVIGFLSARPPAEAASVLAAFRQGLGEAGYFEGKNVTIEFRWAEGNYDRLPELAAELVRRQVTMIAATGGEPSPLAAKAATTTIPIVFTIGSDPVEAGLVASLARPGGNLTGTTIMAVELGPKRLEFIRQLVPNSSAIAMLINRNFPMALSEARGVQDAARSGSQRHHAGRQHRGGHRYGVRKAHPAESGGPDRGNGPVSPRSARQAGEACSAARNSYDVFFARVR